MLKTLEVAMVFRRHRHFVQFLAGGCHALLCVEAHGKRDHLPGIDVLVIANAAFGGAHGQHVPDALAEHGFGFGILSRRHGKTDNQRTPGEQRAIAKLLVQIHQLCRIQKRLPGKVEQRRAPFGSRLYRLIKWPDNGFDRLAPASMYEPVR